MTIVPIPQRLKIMTPNALARRVMALEAANSKCGEAISAAVAEEREACAELAKSMIGATRHEIAAAIRARSHDPH